MRLLPFLCCVLGLVLAASVINAQNLVLVGGNLFGDNSEVFTEIIDLSGGANAKIGLITAASVPQSWDRNAGNPELSDNSVANAEYYAQYFIEFGAASAEWIPLDLDHISNNANQSVIDSISSYSGFFFGGGDQSKLVYCLLNPLTHSASPLLVAIQNAWKAGAVIAGTSAGTMGQVGRDSMGLVPMITGGESYYAFTSEILTYASYGYADQPATPVTMSPYGGLGQFSYGLLDTHFSQRGRQGRLVAIAWSQSTTKGFGVDENTALVVRNATDPDAVSFEVIGQNGVSVFDLTHAYSLDTFADPVTNKPLVNLGATALMNVSWTYLTSGDVYDPVTGEVSIYEGKSSIIGDESRTFCMPSVGSIFSSNLLTAVAIDLVDSSACNSTTGQSHESNPPMTVRLRELEGVTLAFKGEPLPTSNYPSKVYSFVDLYIDIFPSYYIDTSQGP